MTIKQIYSDKLISIMEKEIVFHNYYFPTGKEKVVQIDDIKYIKILEPTIWNGKFRIHGSGNFKIWFPNDCNRPKRDRIFMAVLNNQWVDIGFTVEDGDSVEKIFRSRKLIK